jgi:hypothetical protein
MTQMQVTFDPFALRVLIHAVKILHPGRETPSPEYKLKAAVVCV